MREYECEFTQKVEINFGAEEEYKELFLEALHDAYPDFEWDDTDEGIVTNETVTGIYIPAVYHTANGDGCPAECEYEFELHEGVLEEFVKKFVEENDLIDTQFYLDSIYCELR